MTRSHRDLRDPALRDDGTIDPRAYTVDPETGCHVWAGSARPVNFVPEARWYGALVTVPRWLYEMRHGPLPDDRQVRNTCRNPLCVNVDHLVTAPVAHNVGKRGSPLPRHEVAARLPAGRPGWLAPPYWRVATLIARHGLSFQQVAPIEEVSHTTVRKIWHEVARLLDAQVTIADWGEPFPGGNAETPE